MDREEYIRTLELIEHFKTIDMQWMVFEECSTGLMIGLNVTNNFEEAYGTIMLHEFNCGCKLVDGPFILEDESGIGFKFCNDKCNPEKLNEEDFDYGFILRNINYDEKRNREKEKENAR